MRGGAARLVAALLHLGAAVPAGAQIVLDGTLGPGGALAGPHFSIPASLGRQVGGNLFHSFRELNLYAGESATFSGPGSVRNIVGRVTGGSASSIDGLLRSTVPGAHLYLVNPSGVAFGPNAHLDVLGSFHVATADHVQLGTAGRFDAANPPASVLASAPPSAFGFVRPAPAPISLNGSALAVRPGNSIALTGGDLLLERAWLVARGGQLELSGGPVLISESVLDASSAPGLSAGKIAIRGSRLTIENSEIYSQNQAAGRGGGISLEASRLVVDRSIVFSDTFGEGDGGPLVVSAGQLTLQDGAYLTTDTLGAGTGGGIAIDASESVQITGSSGITASSFAGATGNAGNIRLRTGSLEVSAGSEISSETFGAGNGGTLAVDASVRVRITGTDTTGFKSGLFTSTDGGGNAGAIEVRSPLMQVSDAAWVLSQTTRRVGGAGGSVTLNVGRLDLVGGGQINTTSFGSGTGGSVTINAGGAVTMAGHSSDGFISGIASGATWFGSAGPIFVSAPELVVDGGMVGTATFGVGRAGDIVVRAGRVALANGGRIDASGFFAGSGGSVDVRATGAIDIAGTRDHALTETLLRAFVVLLTGQAVSDEVFDTYRPLFGDFSPSAIAARSAIGSTGGSLRVSAPDITLSGGAVVSSESRGSGFAGGIAIDAARSLKLSEGSAITTQALSADGGDITIRAGQLLYLKDSSITTAVGSGAGHGGNIAIDPVFVVLDNGRIVAQAFGGNGGNIDIASQFFLRSENSLVDASSRLGVSGSVAIRAPQVDLSSRLAALPTSFFDASALLRDTCASRAGRAANSFVAVGRGGLAAAPGCAPTRAAQRAGAPTRTDRFPPTPTR